MKLMDTEPLLFTAKDGNSITYITNLFSATVRFEKPLLVFNYGLVCNFEHFKYQVEYFEKQEYPILLHNYRGHYGSTAKENLSDINFDNITNDLYELLNFLPTNNLPYYFIGHSMGVNVTLEFAKKYPSLVKKIILISGPSLPPSQTMFNSSLMYFLMPLLEAFYAKDPRFLNNFWKQSSKNPLTRHFIMFGGFNRKETSMDFIKIYLKKLSELPMNLFFKLFFEMDQHEVMGMASNVECPVLIMGGDKDRMIPNYYQHLLYEKIENAEFYVIKDGSHVPQVDFFREANERMDLFFRQNLDVCIPREV